VLGRTSARDGGRNCGPEREAAKRSTDQCGVVEKLDSDRNPLSYITVPRWGGGQKNAAVL